MLQFGYDTWLLVLYALRDGFLRIFMEGIMKRKYANVHKIGY